METLKIMKMEMKTEKITQMKTQISSTMRECTRITVCTLMMF